MTKTFEMFMCCLANAPKQVTSSLYPVPKSNLTRRFLVSSRNELLWSNAFGIAPPRCDLQVACLQQRRLFGESARRPVKQPSRRLGTNFCFSITSVAMRHLPVALEVVLEFTLLKCEQRVMTKKFLVCETFEVKLWKFSGLIAPEQ